MNLFQDGDSLKWLSSPEESPTFVDWDRHTDFYMDRSAGVLTVTNKTSHWSLRDLSSKQRSICEMEDLKYSHPTAVYIEDRANVQEEDGTYKVDLRCVPSGWFAYDSIIWFKDGAPINTETSKQSLHLDLKSPFGMGKVSEFQGYYYCSVALDNPSKHIFSPKLLVKFPGLHTFVLHLKSKIPENSKCSDLVSLKIPVIGEFNKYLDALQSNESRLFLKNASCNNSVISTYHHFYILKDRGTEKELQNLLERSISSGTGALFEALKRLGINTEDIALKSTGEYFLSHNKAAKKYHEWPC
ncbi:hypothetical protein AVEN_241581-1 [Araneus ventricosus]|uniref:Ig-like domain-containing protein n=1 Tax=Araneus ventricosus TaxID=182803 RepID=A0A4Y2H8D4_ARAVE|nr:hypothetical protein AVEN_241581-1 [Araneus ventricosus]